jgi:branched-chain amino acid transport system permease protein
MPAPLAAAIRLGARHASAVQAVGLLAPLAILILIPQIGSDFHTSLALTVIVFAIVAMSLDLLGGYTGLISLAHGSFFGLGSYGVAYAEGQGWHPWPSVALAIAVVLFVSLIFGAVAIRAGGITFIILTLALGQIIWGLAYRWVSVSGGDNGIPILVRVDIASLDISTNPVAYYYFVLVVFCACAALLWCIVRSPFGLTLRGIRDNEERMRTLGYDVAAHKLIVFVISGGFAGLAGVLYGFHTLYISPTALDFLRNGLVVLMVVVGGLGTLWGGFFGAIVVVAIQQWLSGYIDRWATVMGVVFILVVLFLRAGIYGSLLQGVRALVARAEREAGGDQVATPLAASGRGSRAAEEGVAE